MRKLDNYKAIILPSMMINVAIFMITFNLLYVIYTDAIIFIALSILLITQQVSIREKEGEEKLRKDVEEEEIRRNERMQTRLKILEKAREIVDSKYLDDKHLESAVKGQEDKLSNETQQITEPKGERYENL